MEDIFILMIKGTVVCVCMKTVCKMRMNCSSSDIQKFDRLCILLGIGISCGYFFLLIG